MTKLDERLYFKRIGKEGIDFTLTKPFSDPENIGSLLSDMAAIFTLIPKQSIDIIDLGCGSGWTSNFYARAGHKVVGIDISESAIEAAKKHFKNPNLRFLCSDFDNLKFRNRFDIAVFTDSLHHADDIEKTLMSVYKILRPGGQILICEPGAGHSKSKSSIEARQKYGVSEKDMPPFISKSVLKKVGFKDIKVYVHPSRLHRISYKKFLGSKRILNIAITRGLISFILSTLGKSRHGLVVASK